MLQNPERRRRQRRHHFWQPPAGNMRRTFLPILVFTKSALGQAGSPIPGPVCHIGKLSWKSPVVKASGRCAVSQLWLRTHPNCTATGYRQWKNGTYRLGCWCLFLKCHKTILCCLLSASVIMSYLLLRQNSEAGHKNQSSCLSSDAWV